MCFLCMLGAAGTSDYYSELQQDVPNNADTKALVIGLIFLVGMVIFLGILKSYDFTSVGKLENIPVFCDRSVYKKVQQNYYFRKQIGECLNHFYNGSYGVLSVGDMESNTRNVEAQAGRVIGEYSTINGKVCIVANAKRTRTDIMFADRYSSYAKNRNKLSRCVCL